MKINEITKFLKHINSKTGKSLIGFQFQLMSDESGGIVFNLNNDELYFQFSSLQDLEEKIEKEYAQSRD